MSVYSINTFRQVSKVLKKELNKKVIPEIADSIIERVKNDMIKQTRIDNPLSIEIIKKLYDFFKKICEEDDEYIDFDYNHDYSKRRYKTEWNDFYLIEKIDNKKFNYPHDFIQIYNLIPLLFEFKELFPYLIKNRCNSDTFKMIQIKIGETKPYFIYKIKYSIYSEEKIMYVVVYIENDNGYKFKSFILDSIRSVNSLVKHIKPI